MLFKRKKDVPQQIDPSKLMFSQLDVTENFGDNTSLKPDDWINTQPLNTMPNPEIMGLPSQSATVDEVYGIGERLSKLRDDTAKDTGLMQNDGVYCPICHIANTQLALLGQPCPKCKRPLLRFGWD